MDQSPNIKDEGADEFFEKYGIRVLKALRRTMRAVDIYSRKLNSEFSITAPQMICLYSLRKMGDVTQSELAKEVDLGMSTVNGIIDRLEIKGLLARRRTDPDRRKVLLCLTDEGHALAEDAPLLLQDKLSDGLRALPELEQAAVTLALERVVDLMGAGDLKATPHLLPDETISTEAEKG